VRVFFRILSRQINSPSVKICCDKNKTKRRVNEPKRNNIMVEGKNTIRFISAP
jgi:hypothetical protein